VRLEQVLRLLENEQVRTRAQGDGVNTCLHGAISCVPLQGYAANGGQFCPTATTFLTAL
jgi:hypothetical protein